MTGALPDRAREVLAFWFLDCDPRSWFGGGEDFDRTIAARFSGTVADARAGRLDDWADSPRGLLALVIVLDQFARNIHRGNGQAYASDAQALDLTMEALARGDEAHLSLSERQFLLMPLMHAEDIAVQQKGIARFEKLAEDGASALAFAKAHADIVAKFGRFPHRNAELGRVSTEAERAWLAEHGNPFG